MIDRTLHFIYYGLKIVATLGRDVSNKYYQSSHEDNRTTAQIAIDECNYIEDKKRIEAKKASEYNEYSMFLMLITMLFIGLPMFLLTKFYFTMSTNHSLYAAIGGISVVNCMIVGIKRTMCLSLVFAVIIAIVILSIRLGN